MELLHRGISPGWRPGQGSDKNPHTLVIALAELPGCASLFPAEDAVKVGYVVETAGIGYLSNGLGG